MNYLVTSLLYDLGGAVHYQGFQISAIDIAYCIEINLHQNKLKTRMLGAELIGDDGYLYKILNGKDARKFILRVEEYGQSLTLSESGTPPVTLIYGEETMDIIDEMLSKEQIAPSDIVNHKELFEDNLKVLTPIG